MGSRRQRSRFDGKITISFRFDAVKVGWYRSVGSQGLKTSLEQTPGGTHLNQMNNTIAPLFLHKVYLLWYKIPFCNVINDEWQMVSFANNYTLISHLLIF